MTLAELIVQAQEALVTYGNLDVRLEVEDLRTFGQISMGAGETAVGGRHFLILSEGFT